MRAIVFANGELLNQPRVVAAARASALIIAADGGARRCMALGFTPNIVVGDLDSLSESELTTLTNAGAKLLRRPPDKDETDLELALLHALEQAAERITVVGAFGGRLDMTVANLLLLAGDSLNSGTIELWHADQTAWIVRPPGGDLRGIPGDTLSLIPLTQEARGISSYDLAYPLQDEALEFGPARGVSNRVTGPEPRVELESGLLLAVHTPGKA
jgi:thiamine pyrophosphokinase